MCVCGVCLCLNELDVLYCTVRTVSNCSIVSAGVTVAVPEFMEVMEGNEFMLCVNVSAINGFEREVNLTFDVIPISRFASNLICDD